MTIVYHKKLVRYILPKTKGQIILPELKTAFWAALKTYLIFRGALCKSLQDLHLHNGRPLKTEVLEVLFY
ncbi:hypothetical protein MASR2M29_11140 [Spirochaetota bacterium]